MNQRRGSYHSIYIEFWLLDVGLRFDGSTKAAAKTYCRFRFAQGPPRHGPYQRQPQALSIFLLIHTSLQARPGTALRHLQCIFVILMLTIKALEE